MKIQIESVSMIYDGDNVSSVRVEHSVRGTVLRNGRGNLELMAEEYAGNEDVKKLEKMVRDSLIEELQSEPEESPES